HVPLLTGRGGHTNGLRPCRSSLLVPVVLDRVRPGRRVTDRLTSTRGGVSPRARVDVLVITGCRRHGATGAGGRDRHGRQARRRVLGGRGRRSGSQGGPRPHLDQHAVVRGGGWSRQGQRERRGRGRDRREDRDIGREPAGASKI